MNIKRLIMIEQILQVIAVSVSQMVLVFFKQLNIRVTVKEHIFKSMIYTFLIQASWLISSAIGISALVEGDYLIVIFYLISGVFGTYLNFKIKV